MLDKKKRARKLPVFSSTDAILPDAIVRGFCIIGKLRHLGDGTRILNLVVLSFKCLHSQNAYKVGVLSYVHTLLVYNIVYVCQTSITINKTLKTQLD